MSPLAKVILGREASAAAGRRRYTHSSIIAREMLSVDEAQQAVLADVPVLGTETLLLGEALGRVLRQDIVAPADVPAADNTAMDGYAVRAADTPGNLRVIADLAAGSVASASVGKGAA